MYIEAGGAGPSTGRRFVPRDFVPCVGVGIGMYEAGRRDGRVMYRDTYVEEKRKEKKKRERWKRSGDRQVGSWLHRCPAFNRYLTSNMGYLLKYRYVVRY